MRAALVFGLLALSAFGCDTTQLGPRTCRSAAECARGQSCVDGECVGGDAGPADGGSPDDVIELRIEPADPVLSSVDGAAVAQTFELILIERDGTERIGGPAAIFSGAGSVGRISASGEYSATGSHGGTESVFATYAGLRANTTVTVNVRRTVIGMGVPADVADRFAAATAGAATTNVLYPLEGAVMPANVYPPTVQWEPAGAATDLFRVRVTEPGVEITSYLSPSDPAFRHAWLVERSAWRAIADTGPASDVVTTIAVDRLDTATSTLAPSAPRTVRLARGSIYGRVYYWVLNRGRTETLDPLNATTTPTVPSPAPAADGNRCVACHTVSPDGRWLHGHRTDGAMMHFDLTTSLAADPAPTRFGAGPALLTSGSFNPTGSHMVGMAGWAGPLLIMNAATGVATPSTGLPASGASFPFWAYDGNSVLYAGNATVDGSGHPVTGDVYVTPRAPDGSMSFGPEVRLHEGASLAGAFEGGTCDSHPVYSPDDAIVVFQHGPRTFSFIPGEPTIPAGALYAMNPDGTGVVRLDNATGGAAAASAYWPSFAPYITDEMGGRRYYWMAFYSRRPYGNTAAGAHDVRQLWIAAIDPDATGDQSFVPYWLPGQDRDVNNVSAYWAPEPCRVTGTSCGSGGECCSARCDLGPDEMPICQPPTECRVAGETCGADADCCDGRCEGNVCIAEVM